MKSYTDYMWFNTKQRREFVNITHSVLDAIRKSEIQEGWILVSAMHITAGVFINDEESGIKQDILEMLDSVAPLGPDYRHHRTGEDNGDAHLKNILVHHQIIVPITKGKADLGPWQQIFYAEFDGMRRKKLILKAIGE